MKKKMNLNVFSLPFLGERKYIKMYFLSCLLGRENEFRFIFSEKPINLNLFSLSHLVHRKKKILE